MNRKPRVPSVLLATGSLVAFTFLPAAAAAPPSPSSQPLADAGSCAWKIVKSATVPGASTLVGLKAFATDDVWAVGSTGSLRDVGTLAEHWNGTSWRSVAVPNPVNGDEGTALVAVDGTSPSDIWAVGVHLINPSLDARPLIIHFDGHEWSVVPNPPGQLAESALNDVVAVAQDDVWAVGARFNGGPGEQDPLAMHWDGSRWSIANVPNPPGPEADVLDAVAASGPNDVWATGQAGERTTLTMHFDGSKWRTVKSPNAPGTSRNELRDVVVRAPDDISAVGSGGAPTQSLAEHWDGAHWSIVATRFADQFGQLFGVTATGVGDELWAVGVNQTPTGTTKTFAQHFARGRWTNVAMPSPGSGDHLDDVAAVGDDVWAVGATAPSLGAAGQAIIEHRC